jgi:hypothetical protein
MFMRVRELGDEIQIELTGVAGRHERILRAVFECRQSAARTDGSGGLPEVSVKTRSNAMRISLRAADGLQVQPDAVYRSLRAALFTAPALG